MNPDLIHVKAIIGIILGLSLTHLIKGSVIFIQHPGRKKFSLLHFLWVFYVFILIIHFWWWEFNLKFVAQWNFVDYFFIITYILLYYLLCAILYPDDLKDYKGYEDYFFSRKKWFFAILTLCFLADIFDTYLKGNNYFLSASTEYYLRIFSHIALCIFAIFNKNRKIHYILVTAFILYEISFILRFFNVE